MGFLPRGVHERFVLLILPIKPLRAPFGPSGLRRCGAAYLLLPLSGLECLTNLACLFAYFARGFLLHRGQKVLRLSQSRFRDTRQISRGKSDRLRRTPA